MRRVLGERRDGDLRELDGEAFDVYTEIDIGARLSAIRKTEAKILVIVAHAGDGRKIGEDLVLGLRGEPLRLIDSHRESADDGSKRGHSNSEPKPGDPFSKVRAEADIDRDGMRTPQDGLLRDVCVGKIDSKDGVIGCVESGAERQYILKGLSKRNGQLKSDHHAARHLGLFETAFDVG